jgi:flagellar protein FlaG
MDISGASGAAPALAAIPTPAAVPPEQAANNRNLIQAVRAVNEAGTLGEQNEITFQMDRNSHQPVIQIIDRTTKQVLEQIPAEYLLRLAETLGQSASSTLSTLA